MPFDGSGNYTPAAAPNFPAVGGAVISSTYYNAVINDIASGLSLCITRDGQGKPTAAMNWNGQNLTNIATLGAATLSLTNALGVASGGTGAITFTSNYLLKGNGTSAVSVSQVFDNGTAVGVGTSSPARLFEVAASAGAVPARIGNNLGNFDIGGSDGSVVNIDSRVWALGLQTGGVERVRIDTSGNIAIGTTSPQGKAEIRTSSGGAVTSALVLSNYVNASVNTGVALYFDPNGAGSLARAASIQSVQSTSGNYADLRFFTANSDTPTERFRITVTGAITSSDLADAVGYKGLPQNPKTASYTLVMSDQAKDIYISGTTAAQTVTIPSNASVAFPVGTVVQITNDSNQNWSVAITSDTLIWSPGGATGTRTIAAQSQATIRKVTATRWWISGNGLS